MVFLPHFPIPNHRSDSDNPCEKLKKILPKLGNPQNNLPPVIHVAGTNGKGSTVSFLASIFQAAGYKTHIYTSPHLHHCNERIVIANNQIDDGYLFEILEEIRMVVQDDDLGLFEGMTLAALLAFSRNQADVCIIETGMGGRVDATNVIDQKIASVITSISLDHKEFLGDNLASIACEKAYIMRSNSPCILAPMSVESFVGIDARSKEIGNEIIYFGRDFNIKVNEDETFNFTDFKNNISFQNLVKPRLLGFHQYINSSLAIAAICNLKQFNINSDHINFGLKNVKWPSRIEKLFCPFLEKDDELWIDGAHNQGGFEILSDFLKTKIVDDFESNKPKRNYLIVGFTRDKSKPELFIPFKEIIDFICAIRVAGEPKPEEAETIKENILKSEINEVATADDLFDAINFLKNLDRENPCRIIICGSLYLARDAKSVTKNYAKV